MIARASRAARSRHPIAKTAPQASGPDQHEAHLDPVEEFAHAMSDYRRHSGRMFPTWCEVLEVLRSLGYRRLGPDAQEHDAQQDHGGFPAKGET